MSDLYPCPYDLAFVAPEEAELQDVDVVYTCLPHGQAMGAVRQAWEAGVRVIDLSADFRLRDVDLYEQWYKVKHVAPELLSEAVYGLVEVYRQQIAAARLVASPGFETWLTGEPLDIGAVTLTLENPYEGSVLSYRHDPGVPLLYIAIVAFLLGLAIRTYWPSYRVRARPLRGLAGRSHNHTLSNPNCCPTFGVHFLVPLSLFSEIQLLSGYFAHDGEYPPMCLSSTVRG